MKMSCGEIQLRERVKAKFGHTVTIGRTAILTQNHNGRLQCHYCGPCERGCSTFSYFSKPVYDREGRAGVRQLHAVYERGGKPCGHGHRAGIRREA